jgi:hypothetical protein
MCDQFGPPPSSFHNEGAPSIISGIITKPNRRSRGWCTEFPPITVIHDLFFGHTPETTSNATARLPIACLCKRNT